MYIHIKDIFDRLIALLALIVLAPLFLILMILIKIDSKGPVFFRQERIGIHKTHFMILKFRTMRVDTPKDIPTHLMQHSEDYITKIGRFLRRTSLDELPQLINIVRGDMAIVGPRPALWNQQDLIDERDKYGANDIRPGLTGWAQVHGRDELDIQTKARYDGEYAEKLGPIIDLKCFFLSFSKVITEEGVVEGGAPCTKSEGNDEKTTQNIDHGTE